MKETIVLHHEIQAITKASLGTDYPVYGMVIHEADDLDPGTRVSYLGANRDFTPLKAGLDNQSTDYGDWADWEWLRENKPVMCDWDGRIDYELDPEDYRKKAGSGTPSDVFDLSYEGNAMAVVRKIYTCSYTLEHNRYVYFCGGQVSEDFRPVGFNVRGIVREYMLIPMFYGSKDEKGRLRSLAGQSSAGTITGHRTQNRDGIDMDTAAQFLAVQASSAGNLFFGGPLVNVLTDIAVMLAKTTNTQAAYGTGMSNCCTSDDDHAGHWGTQPNPILNSQFCGGTDEHSFSNLFHSSVLGSNMLWQRDPYTLLVHGHLKVSPDYRFDLTGESYVDTGCVLDRGDYYAAFDVVLDYGFVPCPDIVGSDSTGYCDHIYANPEVVSVASRFGCCRSGSKAGLFARSMNHSGFNRDGMNEEGEPLETVVELDESFSWWWNFGCSLMQAGDFCRV